MKLYFNTAQLTRLTWLILLTPLATGPVWAVELSYSAPIAPASSEGQQAIKNFRIPAGFTVELFAAEPMLANPVCFTVDEMGRFYGRMA